MSGTGVSVRLSHCGLIDVAKAACQSVETSAKKKMEESLSQALHLCSRCRRGPVGVGGLGPRTPRLRPSGLLGPPSVFQVPPDWEAPRPLQLPLSARSFRWLLQVPWLLSGVLVPPVPAPPHGQLVAPGLSDPSVLTSELSPLRCSGVNACAPTLGWPNPQGKPPREMQRDGNRLPRRSLRSRQAPASAPGSPSERRERGLGKEARLRPER